MPRASEARNRRRFSPLGNEGLSRGIGKFADRGYRTSLQSPAWGHCSAAALRHYCPPGRKVKQKIGDLVVMTRFIESIHSLCAGVGTMNRKRRVGGPGLQTVGPVPSPGGSWKGGKIGRAAAKAVNRCALPRRPNRFRARVARPATLKSSPDHIGSFADYPAHPFFDSLALDASRTSPLFLERF